MTNHNKSGRRTVSRALLVSSFVVAAGWGVMPAATSAQVLKEALAKAYSTNPALLAARARLRATDEGVSQALSGWRPTISLSGDAGKTHSESGGTFGGGRQNRTPRGYGLNITQNIYRGGRTVAATEQAEYLVEVDRANLVSTEQTVLLDAATAYMDVLRDQAVRELNISNERVLRRQLEATQDRFDVGEVTRTDVAQAEARLSRANADRIQAEGDLASSRASYISAVGDAPESLTDPNLGDGIPATSDEAVTRATADNPAVTAAQNNERAAKAAIDVAFGEYLPTVTLEGDVSDRREAITPQSRSQTQSVTARVSVPLYQAGAVSSRVRQAKEVAAQRRRELDDAVRNARESATTAWEALVTARAQIKSLNAEIRASKIALEGVQQEAQVGSRTVLDVLDAEQEFLDARVSLVRAKRDQFVAGFQLLSATGRLTATELELAVEQYDFKTHYDNVRGKIYGTGPSVK